MYIRSGDFIDDFHKRISENLGNLHESREVLIGLLGLLMVNSRSGGMGRSPHAPLSMGEGLGVRESFRISIRKL